MKTAFVQRVILLTLKEKKLNGIKGKKNSQFFLIDLGGMTDPMMSLYLVAEAKTLHILPMS